METIHSETYALMIETYIKDKTEKERILNGIKENDIKVEMQEK